MNLIPKKRFGQHFLKDRNIIRKVIDGAGLKEDDIVLEIGPGLGDMTAFLAQRAKKVIAVELDRDLYSTLLRKFGGGSSEFGTDNVEVINADALKFDLRGVCESPGGKFKVVANLPYNISTPLLFKFFEDRECISSMTLMFQKEVAERLVAKPGTRDYGTISVFAQLYTVPSLLFSISPSAFMPPPAVDSAVVRFDILASPSVKADNEKLMLQIVKAAFGQRRKTLLNALASGLKLPKKYAEAALREAGIDGSRRGETLTLSEFCAISNELLMSL